MKLCLQALKDLPKWYVFWASLVVASATVYQQKGRVSMWATAILTASLLSLLIRVIWLKNRLVTGEEESEFALIDEKRKAAIIEWLFELPESGLFYLLLSSTMLICFGNEFDVIGYVCLVAMLLAGVIWVGQRNLQKEAEAAERDGDEGQHPDDGD